MPVIRVEKNKNYTQMSNFHLRDKNLSLRAIGLLSKMLSLPDEWDYTVSGLAAICKEGRDAVRATLMELEAAGYMVRQQVHAEDGTFSGNEYVVYEKAKTQPLTENPSTVNPSTVNPPTVEPTTETPLTENSTQINKDLIKDFPNIPPIIPQGGSTKKQKRSEPKKQPDWKPERFDGFWAFYPRHTSKQAAIKAWDKLKPSDELIAVIGKALRRQKASEEWQNGIGIPYPSTYLNNQRWTDEVDVRIDTGANQEFREPEVQVWS